MTYDTKLILLQNKEQDFCFIKTLLDGTQDE